MDFVMLYKVVKRSLNSRHIIDQCFRGIQNLHKHHAHFLKVRSQKRQGCQSRTTNGKALTGSGSRVPQRIERIGTLTHLGTQTTHLGISAGIVGNGAVSIGGQGNPQSGKHPHCSNTNPIETNIETTHIEFKTGSESKGKRNGHHYNNQRNSSRNQARTHTTNDNGSGTCLTGTRNVLGGLVSRSRKILRRLANTNTNPIETNIETTHIEFKTGSESKGKRNGHHYNNQRNSSRNQARTHTTNDNGSGTCLTGTRNVLGGLVSRSRKILRRLANTNTCKQ